jgi:iron-sulfur cluster repair protein YtfE (RIC family)
MSAKKTGNVIEFLESQLAEIEAARYDVVDKTDTSLQQIIDNIVQLYLSTLYKLRFLS